MQEAAVIGVDCLGFDLRVCSGTQVQTLRFAFPTKVCAASHIYESTYISISKYTLTLSISKKYGNDKISRSIWILETTT